jgi:hypothetical protein
MECLKRFVDIPTGEREFKPNTMRVHVHYAWAQDGPAHVHNVFTGPDFGCCHHATKESPSLSVIVGSDVDPAKLAECLAEISSVYSELSGGDELVIKREPKNERFIDAQGIPRPGRLSASAGAAS